MITHREFKFRTLDSANKQFNYSNNLTKNSDQYINILDCNNKEIYENDIVEELDINGRSFGGFGYVKYLPDCAGYTLGWPNNNRIRSDLHQIQGIEFLEPGWTVCGAHDPYYGKNYRNDYKVNSARLKIIGNIYENMNIFEDASKKYKERNIEINKLKEKTINNLKAPQKAWKALYSNYDPKYYFIDNNKKYYFYERLEREEKFDNFGIQSIEPKSEYMRVRNILGMDFKFSGIDHSPRGFLGMKRRACWNLECGYLSYEQIKLIINTIKSVI